MRGSVEYFIADLERRLQAATADGRTTELAAFLAFTLDDCAAPKADGAGVLAAMAEDPDFLQPVRTFQRALLDRLLASSRDPGQTLLVYLALEGLRSAHMFNMDVLTPAELEQAKAAMQKG